MSNELKKYLFQDQSVRVQAVRLTEAWQTGLVHQHYPACVERLLGELTAAAVLLASNIKLDGSLVLQLQGDGPVALIVVECNVNLNIRATATLREGHEIPEDGTLQSLLNANGQGRFIVVLDPNRDTTDMQPYQGIVPLEGDTVAQVLELYMRNSEQLDTRLWLAANGRCATGMLLQRLPGHGGNRLADAQSADDTWQRAVILSETLQTDELLNLESDQIVKRLFWEEALLTFEPKTVHWFCPCTRERVGNMLRMLGREEIESILGERENIDVSCNFCGKPYAFDAVDCAGLFTENLDSGHANPKSVH
ncbi:redox-regulated molecular chaperone Hsp33 [Pusillimonas sp. T2]|uniref:Hsp33 family molecular chaperone HslO n=1 Tax=Pusillimonas sp. T2 TaxID=1548123 RepID=UPI000B9CFC8B|nr:Hsp33 family molecular chaperone HslO [Pusillimonas sp. T2]OXR50353.1 redox-regulated molecular chaperone Hsp33 [Pusillimonas sp. T2]